MGLGVRAMEGTPEKQPVRVTILSRPYTLLATGDPREVEAVAASVDQLMLSIAARAPLRQEPRDSGGAGRGIGGGKPGELCHGHHRYRSAAIRAAVRALPEPRAREPARYRHRLLHEPARRGDPD